MPILTLNATIPRMTIILKADKRDKIGRLNTLREQGYMPAVFYGRKEESTPIQIKKIDFIKTWRDAGESTVIKLDLGDNSIEALIKEVDFDPIKNEPRHADFYVFEKGHKVEIAVPLVFEGIPVAVKELGGILVKVMHELNIEADPSKLPHEIKVDVSKMSDLDSQILAKDITLPSGVELIDEADEVVASIATAKEEDVKQDDLDLSQIEVEKKGKQEEKEENS